MNGTAQRSRPKPRLFDGRLEKRLTMSVPVYLASLGEPRARERTVTENVSPHGARVISKRSWRSGEEALIAPLTGEFPQVGTVVYSRRKNGGGRFCLGVEFLDRSVKWENYSVPSVGRLRPLRRGGKET
jgi:hypothetical protein